MFTFQRGWYPWENEACYANVSPDGYQRDQLRTTNCGIPGCRRFPPDLGGLWEAATGDRLRSIARLLPRPSPQASTSGWRLTAPPSTLTAWRITVGQSPHALDGGAPSVAGRQLDGCPGPLGLRRGGSGPFPCSKSIWPAMAAFAPADALRQELHQQDYAWKRPGPRASTRTPSERKNGGSRAQIKRLGPHWVPALRGMRPISALSALLSAWGRADSAFTCRSPGQCASGGVWHSEHRNRHRLFVAAQRQRSEDFRAFLSVVAHHYATVGGVVAGRGPEPQAQASLALAEQLGCSWCGFRNVVRN